MKRSRLLLPLLLTATIGFCAVRPAKDEPRLHTRQRYVLEYGDSLALEYRFTPEFNQTVVVQPDGFINLTLIGDLRVSGLTLDQVHDLVLARLGDKLNQPELNLILKEFERPYVAVAGEVDKPGRLEFRERTSALQAVMLSGGFKDTAEQSQVLVFRRVNGDMSRIIELNLHRVHRTGDLEHDLVLEPGDIVLVPRNKLSNVARFVKATNLGLYLDPLTYVTK